MKEELKRVRELIEKGWTQGKWARDRYGNTASVYSPDAVCWCLVGAINSIRAYDIIDLIAKEFPPNAFAGETSILINWNDAPGRTQQEVLNLIDTVLEKMQ